MKKSRLAGKLDNEKKYLSYKIVCRQIKLRLRNHKRNILHDLAIEKDAKKFINYVNGEIKSNKPIVHLTDSNGKRVDTDEQMANLFNEIFASNYVKPTACNSALGLNLTTDEISNSFMINVTYEETLRALRSSKSRAAGPDGISGDIIRNLAPLIVKPLQIIFLQSVGQHCFPSLWKCARVVPLFKGKGSRHGPLNSRCINLTNIFGKCLESIIKNQLVDYLEVNNLLHKAQHGFRAGCSTVTNLLVTDKYIAEWVNAGDEFDILSFDLCKAFDRVQHSVLLRKFKQLKFQNGPIKWFMDFLSYRTQYVSCGSARSATFPVKSGVVAGSVLGPVLFSIVIDSLPYELDATLVMFADDFKVLINVTKMGIVRARSVVGIVRNWCEVNELDLSVSKSCCLHSKKNFTVTYNFDDSTLPCVDMFKDLGVCRSNNGGYSSHANYVASKARRVCGMILNNLVIPDAYSGWRLYQAYVLPIICYACIAWNPDSRCDSSAVEKIQRMYTKRLPGLRDYSYEDRLARLGALSVEKMRYIADMTFVFKLIHNLTPFNTVDFGLRLSANNSRGPRFLHDKFLHTSARHVFRYRVPITWNKLPQRVRQAAHVSSFRSLLFTSLQNST